MREFQIVSDNFRKHPDKEIILPKRQTRGSAGYDFYCPEKIIIRPRQVEKIHTDIKVKMFDYECLMLYVRSSIGINRNLMLANSTGIIDSDFYNNEDCGGNIQIALYNYGNEYAIIEENERVLQGIFINYLTIEKEDFKNTYKRKGGIGSTNS